MQESNNDAVTFSRKQLDKMMSDMLKACEILRNGTRVNSTQEGVELVKGYLTDVYNYIKARAGISEWQQRTIFTDMCLEQGYPETRTGVMFVNFDFLCDNAWEDMHNGIPQKIWAKLVLYAQRRIKCINKKQNPKLYKRVKRIAKGKLPKGMKLV